MKTFLGKFPVRTGANWRGAFTLIELLVIIAMVAVLAGLHAAACASAKDRSKVAQCAANVKQLTLALHIYGGENNNKLPQLVPPGSATWAWDLPWTIGEALLACGLEKKNFYCPGTAPRYTDVENFADPIPNRTLWGFGNTISPNGFHIAGYVFTFSGPLSKLKHEFQNSTLLSEHYTTASGMETNVPNAERTLIADVTISNSASDSMAGYKANPNNGYTFQNIAGGFYKPHHSAHLKMGVPEGGNIGFKDGHVAWRKFQDMDQRAASGPGFWF